MNNDIVTIYDVSIDEERPITQRDVSMLTAQTECCWLFLDIVKRLGVEYPVDWEAYRSKLRNVRKFLEGR
jgi:hypothetical protein